MTRHNLLNIARVKQIVPSSQISSYGSVRVQQVSNRLLLAQSSPMGQANGQIGLFAEGQEVIVVKLRNFLDIVHFFAYCNHILLVLQYGYETGQAATHQNKNGVCAVFVIPRNLSVTVPKAMAFSC